MNKFRVFLTGGLGNQLFQYAFAYSYLTEFDTIEIEKSIGSASADSNGNPEIFNFLVPKNTVVISSNNGYFTKKLFNLLLRLSAVEKNRLTKKFGVYIFCLSMNKSYKWNKQNLLVPNGTGFDRNLCPKDSMNFAIGYFQSYRWLHDSGKLNDFKKLSNKKSSDINWVKLANSETPLVVQVRLGDYTNEKGFGILGPSYFNAAIKEVMKSHQFRSIWLFSNDVNKARDYISTEYQSLIRIIDPNLSAAETLQIMRLGSAYVISNSTFGWWGAFLSHTENPMVIYPRPWFLKLETPFELCPPNWIGRNPWL
jgi:hypothetical protein